MAAQCGGKLLRQIQKPIALSSRHHRDVVVKWPKSITGRERLESHYKEDMAVFTQENLSAPKDVETVNPPLKVQRDELSILKALNSTVERDYSAPRCKLIDFPGSANIGFSAVRKGEINKASGKSAAQWFLRKNRRFMNFNTADPPIKEFFYNRHEIGLTNRLLGLLRKPKNKGKVKECFEKSKTKHGIPPVYPDKFEEKILENLDYKEYRYAFSIFKIYLYCDYAEEKLEGFKPISGYCYNRLLDAMALHAGHDPVIMDPSEIYYSNVEYSALTDGKNWSKKNAARLVFEKMPEKNAWAYNSMLMGMLTHDAKEEANIWFKEMQEKKIPVELECYNKLLATLAPKGMSWEEIKKRLCEIAEAGLRPNLATFNNALAAISASKVDEIVEHLEEVIGEMKALDIEPSLGTWAACLDAVYVKGNSRDIGYVTKILDTHVAGKEFTMRDVHDFEFFYSAMKVAHSLNSSTLAQKINETLEIGMNYHFIGHFEKSRIYYFMYFELLAESESVDTVMDFYTKYVPYTFNIKQKHIWTMLNMIRMQEDGYKFLRRILVDARGLFPYTIDFAVLVLDMVKKQAEQDEDSEMKEYYADVAWLVLDWFAILNESSLISVTAKHMGSDIVSNVLSVLLNNNIKDIGRCWTAFQIGKDLQGEIGKDLRESVLEKLGRGCIEAGEATYATECLEFMHKNKCRGTAEMAEDVLDLRKEEDEDEFPEKEREKIQNILKESSGWIYKTGKQFTTDKPMRREIQFKM